MKYLSALLLAGGFALVMSASANAAPLGAEDFYSDSEVIAADPNHGNHPHHPCHGRASGTADPACGSLTGGPSGSLF